MPITILLPRNIKFTKIIQTGDIHVKISPERDTEYREVFDKFYDKIDESPQDTVILILGDIFCNYVSLSTEQIQLAREFILNCCQRRYTIIIPGNHDLLVKNKERLDSISPIVNSITSDKLFYIKKSGLYGFGNLLFNHYGVLENSDEWLMGKDIPQIYRNQYDHVIGLIHAPIDNSYTDLGFRIDNKLLKTDIFDEHDLILCGDIHIPQTLYMEKEINEDELKYYEDNGWEKY